MEIPASADAVVIGAGSFGCSAALELSKAGCSTVLLDRFEPASQTSLRAAGNTKQIRPQEVLTRLSIDSVRRIERFTDETGVDLPYHQTGSLHLARNAEEAERGRGEVAAAQRFGVPVAEVTADQLQEIAPFARSDGVEFMWYSKDDLYLQPSDLLSAYLGAARGYGCSVVGDCAVVDVRIEGGAVVGVDTQHGPVATPIVIDTAGAWSYLIARRAGIDVPLVPMRHQAIITKPTPLVSESHPICRVLDVGVYMRPWEGGLLFGGFEANPEAHDMQRKPHDFQIGDLQVDASVLDDLIEDVTTQFPLLPGLEVDHVRAGLPTITPDNMPIVGPVDGLEGFFIASGCCVGGLSISPSVGALLCDLATDREPQIPIGELYLERFRDMSWTTEELVDECRSTYSGFYVKGTR